MTLSPFFILYGDLIPHIISDDVDKVYNGNIKDPVGTFQHELVVGITIDDSLGNPGDRCGDRQDLSRVFLCLLDPILIHQIRIGVLAPADCISGGNDLVFLHIDHGIHLHKAGIIFQRHEIGWFPGNVEQQRNVAVYFRFCTCPSAESMAEASVAPSTS